jgi:hypothetical protein
MSQSVFILVLVRAIAVQVLDIGDGVAGIAQTGVGITGIGDGDIIIVIIGNLKDL